MISCSDTLLGFCPSLFIFVCLLWNTWFYSLCWSKAYLFFTPANSMKDYQVPDCCHVSSSKGWETAGEDWPFVSDWEWSAPRPLPPTPLLFTPMCLKLQWLKLKWLLFPKDSEPFSALHLWLRLLPGDQATSLLCSNSYASFKSQFWVYLLCKISCIPLRRMSFSNPTLLYSMISNVSIISIKHHFVNIHQQIWSFQ